LMAMRINHVIALDSPRKCFQFRCAFRKHSCVKVSARSTSRNDASRKRKICGRWLSTMLANSCAASSSAASAVIGSIAVPAAIDLVDVPFRRKFTALPIHFHAERYAQYRRRWRPRGPGCNSAFGENRIAPVCAAPAAHRGLLFCDDIICCGDESTPPIDWRLK